LERGDIYHVDLNPIQGREQAGARFVLVVSRKTSMFWEHRSSARLRRAETLRATLVLRFH
jgi:hypothetical protein